MCRTDDDSVSHWDDNGNEAIPDPVAAAVVAAAAAAAVAEEEAGLPPPTPEMLRDWRFHALEVRLSK